MVEATWRAQDVLARLALTQTPPDNAEAEQRLQAALGVLEALRASLRDAGIADTLLENDDCVAVYARLARLLRQTRREAEALAFLEQAGWPPLAARLDAEVSAGADQG